ncbi:hypothetical protein D3C85_346060 [compost metagenome]
MAGALIRAAGKALVKKAREVAKGKKKAVGPARGGRTEKDMGKAERVEPKRLAAPKKEAPKAPEKKGGKAKAAVAAGAASLAIGIGVDKGMEKAAEDKKSAGERGKATVDRAVGKATAAVKAKPAEKKAEPKKTEAKPSAKKPASKSTGSVKTKGGDYPVYSKSSQKAKEFRAAFAAAKKAGKSIFTWDGRKYNTKTKK